MEQPQNPIQDSIQSPSEFIGPQAKPKWPIVVFSILGIILLASTIFLFFQNQKIKTEAKVTNFNECSVIKGALVRESYPAVCVLPSGKSFTQKLTDKEKSQLIPPQVVNPTSSISIPSDETASWKTYTNGIYSLKYPSNWTTSKDIGLLNDPDMKFILDVQTKNTTLNIQDWTKANVCTKFATTDDPNGCTAYIKGLIKNSIETTFLANYSGMHTIFKNGNTIFDVSLAAREPNLNFEEIKDIYSQILSTFKFLDKPLPTATTSDRTVLVNGADLKDIKYTLLQGWEAKLNDNLFVSPVNGGGYLSIRVYNYPNNIGRREYYCQVSKVCIEGITYFNEMSLGNISGYIANALDNSGGGAEYFGAKGNKFYIISSYNPPSPNEFEKNYRNVLNSLVF